MSDNQYWATQKTDEVVGELDSRVASYYQFCEQRGLLTLWRRSYRAYNAAIGTKGGLTSSGNQNEYTQMVVNHYRNILKHILMLTTSQRPALDARAANNDYKSQAQTILAQGLLDYYLKEKKVERILKEATELAVFLGEAFITTEWNPNHGEIIGIHPESQQELFEGDVECNAYSPIDVIRDVSNPNAECNWWIIRKWKNKFDLIAEYPASADAIASSNENRLKTGNRFIRSDISSVESDLIPLYVFYHKPTKSLPNGRYIEFLDNTTALIDGDLPYDEVPVYRIVPSTITDTPFGYTVGFDLLPLQEALDGLYSTIITNQKNFGVQNILIPKSSDINYLQLAGGLNVIEYNTNVGKPEALNLTHTPAEVFNFLQNLQHDMETISGVNSVARGNPEANMRSGSALALVQSMAIQFSQDLQQSYAQLLEDVGTGIINLLKVYANRPRIAVIAGKNNRSELKEFSSDDIKGVSRVTVDVGNPLSKTTAGRVELAQQLLQSQLIKTPEEFIQVINTGRLEPLIQGQTAELLLIKAENERLSEGVNIPVLIVDNHTLHITEHKSVLASPEVREMPNIVQATLEHLQQHIDMLKNSDPTVLSLLGDPTDFVAQAAPQQAPQQAQQPQPPQAAKQLDATNPVTQQAGLVNMPSQPKNPITGQPNQ